MHTKNLLKVVVSLMIAALLLSSCSFYKDGSELSSPDGNIKVKFFLNKAGEAFYTVRYKDKLVIDTSEVADFDFRDKPSMKANYKIKIINHGSFDERWTMPWGEQKIVRNNYIEQRIHLKETTELEREVIITFKVYNDGVAFSYDFPMQKNLMDVVIMDENSQFKLTGDHECWWQPGDWDIYEHLYNTTKVSEINAIAKRNNNNLAQSYIPYNAVNTPVTMKTKDGIYLSFHEANLTNYSGMTLKVDTKNLLLQSELVGSPDSSKVKIKTPFITPYRTIQIAEKPGDLIESKMILNLNEPNVLADLSWIKPTKYVGIWWGMHIGKYSWDMKSGKHGATTENAKKYIDFAAENGIGAVLIEGWNTGWEHWIGFEDREGVFDFVTPYPDYNLKEVVKYAKDKGIEIIMHNETSAAVRTYEQQMDTAFALCKKLGIHAVKTGYVGKIIPKGEFHHGQYMVNHYRKVVETAAKYHIMVDAHEPIKPTGIRRTYPNMMTREGLRGQEFNAWSSDGGNPPEHLTIIPFTRMLAGPIDYTPGIFDIKFNKYKPNNQVNTTVAQQLALYVVIYSPMQMAADLPENYEGKPAFQFIRDVAVDWDQTKVLNGEIGDYVTIARKAKNSGNWFLGSITDENARDLTISLDFLDSGKKYKATIYKDGPTADWKKNPTSIDIVNKEVTSNDKLNLHLAPGGGTAISFFPVK